MSHIPKPEKTTPNYPPDHERGDVTGNDASRNYVTGCEDADNKGATTHKNATAQNNFEF